jgi:8-oxo-dGTP pyrophosphatase MutT (NUDIX family)
VTVSCLACGAPAARRVVGGRERFDCAACGAEADRALVDDPSIRSWTAGGQLWHETAGIFVRDGDRFLFFERTRFPYALTVPAGHVDAGEPPAAAAVRELREEVSLAAPSVTAVGTADVVGDTCRRGADAHRWHAFLVPLAACAGAVAVTDEGERPQWLLPRQALDRDLTLGTRVALERLAGQAEA